MYINILLQVGIYLWIMFVAEPHFALALYILYTTLPFLWLLGKAMINY